MYSQYVLPLLYLCFAGLSLIILNSIAPGLLWIQFFSFVLGGILAWAVSTVPLYTWKKLSPILYGLSVISLFFPLLIGTFTRGSRAWIPIGPFHLQPSQFTLPIVMLFLATILEHISLKKTKHILLNAGVTLVPWLLIMIEPDLGTSLVFALATLLVILFTDIPTKWVAIGTSLLVVAMIVGWQFILLPYQKERITSFMQPTDLQGAGYNARQAVIAVGSGQLTGRGLGHGVQSQLRFLPERHTDFVFASLAEEMGLIGGAIVLLLYLSVCLFMTRYLFRSDSKFVHFLVMGILNLLIVQIFINIGMNMNLMPITGITLPLLSYGGSSILAFSFSFGLLERVVKEQRHREAMYFH